MKTEGTDPMITTSTIDRAKILVLGDSGVGKTSFVHLAVHNEPIKSPSWTVGCALEVKLHEYKEGTKEQKPFFIEFWDIGGSHFHRNARPVFYNHCHGAILVYDLTNRKSEQNLLKWVKEICKGERKSSNTSKPNIQALLTENFDTESIIGNCAMPFLVIGTKLDQIDERKTDSGHVAGLLMADEILLDCQQTRYLAAGTSNAVKLSRFCDRVIENKLKSQKSSYTDRFGLSNQMSTKYYSAHQE